MYWHINRRINECKKLVHSTQQHQTSVLIMNWIQRTRLASDEVNLRLLWRHRNLSSISNHQLHQDNLQVSLQLAAFNFIYFIYNQQVTDYNYYNPVDNYYTPEKNMYIKLLLMNNNTSVLLKCKNKILYTTYSS